MSLDFLKELVPIFYNQHCVKAFSRTAPFNNHWHDRMEILYILEGSLELQIDKADFTARKGDIVIFPPGVLHSGIPMTPDTDYYVLMFELGSFINQVPNVRQYITALSEKRIALTPITTDKDIVALVKKLYSLQDSKESTASLISSGCIYELLALLLDRCLAETQPEFKTTDMFSRVIAYIQENYNQPLSSSLLCQKFGYSQSYFSRRFIAEIGMTPTAFIRTVRLEAAADILEATDTRINEIADVCGFKDIKYFNRCFRELYGITPSQYRSAKREAN